MRLLKFVPLTSDASRAVQLVEREVGLPQREGTILADLVWLRTSRVELTEKAADPFLAEDDREAARSQLQAVLEMQHGMETDMRTDPGGYLAWFWAEANAALMRQVRRHSQ